MSEKISTLINRVGVPLVYSAKVNDAGSHVDAEVTAAQADKLTTLLGEKNVKFLRFKGTHVIVRITVAELEKAAAEAQKVARGSGVLVTITSRVLYEVTTQTEDAPNAVTAAWWSAESLVGEMTINGAQYPIAAGEAKDFYSQPEGDAGKEWNPERTVYAIELPVTDAAGIASNLVLTSYGVTNLIRRVASRNERIG